MPAAAGCWYDVFVVSALEPLSCVSFSLKKSFCLFLPHVVCTPTPQPIPLTTHTHTHIDAYAPDGPLRAACIDTLARKLDSLFMLPPHHHERCMLEAFVLAVVPGEEAGLGGGAAVSGLERLGSRLVRHASSGGALGPSLSLRAPNTTASPSTAPRPPRPPLNTPTLPTPTPTAAAAVSCALGGERVPDLARGASEASPFYDSQPGGLDPAPSLPHRRGGSLEEVIVPLAPSGAPVWRWLGCVCVTHVHTEKVGGPLGGAPSLLLKGDSTQLQGLVTGALLRVRSGAFCNACVPCVVVLHCAQGGMTCVRVLFVNVSIVYLLLYFLLYIALCICVVIIVAIIFLFFFHVCM